MSFSPKRTAARILRPTTSVEQTCLRWFLSAIPFNWAHWPSPLHGFHGIYQKGWNDFEGKGLMRDYVTFSKFTTKPRLGDIFSNFRCLRVVFTWAFVSSLLLWKLFHDKIYILHYQSESWWWFLLVWYDNFNTLHDTLFNVLSSSCSLGL